jgi:putative inorganic carbon (hco3(-)) transporter
VRDILLTGALFVSLPFILWRPQVGVLIYVWLSVMNPHRYTWSFAYEFNFAAIVGALTVISALLSKDLKAPPLNGLIVALALFAIWTGVTTIFAIHPEPSFERWKTLMKTMLVAFLIPMLFHKREDIHLLIWVLALSIAFYGTKGGMWTLLTGGAARVYGPMDSYIADNNAIALAIVIVVPLLRYLHLTTPHRSIRWALIVMMLLCGVAVLGTYSRGAFLAILAMLAVLWWKGRRKLPVLLAILFAVPIALSTMPEKWYERMETIKTYERDSSAQMRLNAWATMVNIANARPLTGAGFEAGTQEEFDRYSPDPSFPPQDAHSIYFQALGEQGYVGLALYLCLLLAFWFKAGAIARAAKNRGELAWAMHLGLMMQVSLLGFAVGGAFLSLVNFDVPYYLMGAVAATLQLVERQLEVSGAGQTAPRIGLGSLSERGRCEAE